MTLLDRSHWQLSCLLLSYFVGLAGQLAVASGKEFTLEPAWTLDEGGIIRGDPEKKQMSLIFTGSEYGEGTEPILDTLKKREIKASFFVTGEFLADADRQTWLKRLIAEGHYLGPHSHGHLLYAPWEDRAKSLVTEEEFKTDLNENLSALRALGACPRSPVYFVPPFEWYNANHVQWARQLRCVLINFTPGSGSHRDWAPEGHKAFRTSQQILSDVLTCETKDEHGLNGHLLLLHLGSERKDKMYTLLGPMIDELRNRGYQFVRVDELLRIDPAREEPQ